MSPKPVQYGPDPKEEKIKAAFATPACMDERFLRSWGTAWPQQVPPCCGLQGLLQLCGCCILLPRAWAF